MRLYIVGGIEDSISAGAIENLAAQQTVEIVQDTTIIATINRGTQAKAIGRVMKTVMHT